MTIEISVSVTGETMGREFAGDSEEAAYLFTAMASQAGARFGDEVAEYLYGEDRAKVVTFLRNLADKIDTSD